VATPVEWLCEAFLDASRRARRLRHGETSGRFAARAKSARFDCLTGGTRMNISFLDKATVWQPFVVSECG
jgi:hypothetical protein